MGVASIPDYKDQRSQDEWNVLNSSGKMDVAKGATEEFVTVVSVGNQPAPENFVTVLSIGSGKKDDDSASTTLLKNQSNGIIDAHLEEEVEVYRLPGEKLGFGLKFEGGNKTSERVRRLFVQSCAEQSPASRAKCSWGALGEGDEVLSIDGVPVTHMTRLDCVRRLKESQLVIRLMVRCRGALRPEVVSAERKTSPEKKKVPPELPSAPPPVPPRKLRQPRGSADGEANPSPVKKTWDNSRSQSNSQNGSQNSSPSSQTPSLSSASKSTTYESCESSPKSMNGSTNQESPKGTSPKERSPDLKKSKQEPPEAMVYLDARSQCGSQHGSTSDDTGSSLSTVVDRFSTSDRVSTISTVSTASTTSEQQPGEFSRIDQDFERNSDRDHQLSRSICPFEHFDGDFPTSPPDYLLRRLASSEEVTHVESRGEVERITAVVAPNTVLIEETITFQPPLSFQDAPLSYGHEARPDLFYTADLAADSTTHFRPIKDDAELVERVNGDHQEFHATETSPKTEERPKDSNGGSSDKTPPPLPARNHVNRITVNQNDNQNELRPRKLSDMSSTEPPDPPEDLPVLPPKPLPRKDIKIRRKRPPPPPPPTIAPRRDVKPPPLPESRQTNLDNESNSSRIENNGIDYKKVDEKTGFGGNVKEEQCNVMDTRHCSEQDLSPRQNVDQDGGDSNKTKVNQQNDEKDFDDFDDFDLENSDGSKTNKVLEIIEIRKARALSPQKVTAFEENESNARKICLNDKERINEIDKEKVTVTVNNERKKSIKSTVTISTEFEDSEEESVLERSSSASNGMKLNNSGSNDSGNGSGNENPDFRENGLSSENSPQRESEDDETYRSLDEINDDLKNSETNRMTDDEDTIEEDDTTDESDDGDYYWQSNLATIGEEEETNSLEYTSANKEIIDVGINLVEKPEVPEESTETDVFSVTARNDEVDSTNQLTDFSETEAKKLTTETVNGRMENCGGGQRLPPDGDEFPAAYQEFGSNNNNNTTNNNNNSNSNQQYRFVSAAKSSTITTNGGLVCGENESFVGPERTLLELLEGNVVSTRSIILPDNRITLSNVETVCQESNGKVEINGKLSVSNVENLGRDTDLPPRERRNDDAKSAYSSEDFVKKNTVVSTYSTYGNQSNSNVVVSEKKIEITGYYHKDVAPVIDEIQEQEKEVVVDTPPPLPLTGPPKMEVTYTKTVQKLEQPQRKFSLNGELWRQDDKSERSVRDKIAMFSSQNSLDTPLFPSTMTVTSVTSNGRRLSKYKSSEDVCNEEKSPCQKEKSSFFADRTQSSFDLTDSTRNSSQDSNRKYVQRSPSFSQSPSLKTAPTVPQKPTMSTSTFDKQNVPNSPTKSYCSTTLSQNNSPQNNGLNRNPNSSNVPLKPVTSTTLTRATSFSGSTPYGQDRNSTANDLYLSAAQISRTNSLASTFRKPNEEIRRASLNQLIEQRRRSICKLRGLVIPEKEAVPIDQPIVDLPEIKSRDSILLHQMSKVNIQDKWGSQSSLASNTSTASAPLKATTSFKMPAPQIHSKYSPAFKRKSLTVYGSSVTSPSLNGSAKNSQTSSTPMSTSTTLSEPPKSLESICSPTRSDYSFEFVSASGSPEGSRSRPRTVHRKTRMDYDDSDNDSAVSSSQSSISRGFSPPMSPVPSERSTVSSERSYVSTETNYQGQSLIMSSPTRTYNRDVIDYSTRTSNLDERTYISERSSSSSGGSNPRSPQPTEINSRNSQIPQRQLRRSNSTDTNCSTSSTLTSGSQASAESLSRRVLKPQSVEAINRKNILASARCRSGRDLNGSPLIQRKFSDEEDNSAPTENGTNIHQRTNHGKNIVSSTQDVKIAYIEVTDPFEDDETYQTNSEEPKLPPKRSIPLPAARPPKSEMLEPSNDLKMWVRAEAKALARSAEEKSANKIEKSPAITQDIEISSKVSTPRNSRQSSLEEQVHPMNITPQNRNLEEDSRPSPMEISKQRSRPSVTKKAPEDPNDLLTILTTKSRSRSAIHVDEGAFGRSKSQMSLEDILSAKTEVKLSRAQSIEGKVEKNGVLPGTPNIIPRSTWESKDNRYGRRSSMTSNDSWSEDRPFVSKIPTLGRSRLADSGDEMMEVDRSKTTLSKIPTARNLGRRSASVTDMKKALEKNDVNSSSSNQHHGQPNTHNRFPSLDSSVDENICPIGTDGDTDRCCSEQFGSISSLASSTSLISQQELAQLVEEASLEEARGAHDVVVVLLHKENPTGSVGITLAGGADCEVKEITVHRVLAHSIADKDGRVQRGDRILSINGRSTRGLTHRESLTVLKQPRSEVVLVVSRARLEEGCKLRSRTASVETIIEGFETNGSAEDTAWGPPSVVAVYKDGAGLGFSLEGGRDSPLGDRPLVIKKIFTGGAAEKTGALKAGDQLLEVNGSDVTRMSRIEAWSLMKKLHDGEVNLLVRHPATKSS